MRDLSNTRKVRSQETNMVESRKSQSLENKENPMNCIENLDYQDSKMKMSQGISDPKITTVNNSNYDNNSFDMNHKYTYSKQSETEIEKPQENKSIVLFNTIGSRF